MARESAMPTITIPMDLHTALYELSDESNVPYDRLVERALRSMLIRSFGDDYGPGRLDRYFRNKEGE